MIVESQDLKTLEVGKKCSNSIDVYRLYQALLCNITIVEFKYDGPITNKLKEEFNEILERNRIICAETSHPNKMAYIKEAIKALREDYPDLWKEPIIGFYKSQLEKAMPSLKELTGLFIYKNAINKEALPKELNIFIEDIEDKITNSPKPKK